MAVLSGFQGYKRHVKLSENEYKAVSEWTHSDTVEMNDGRSLTEAITNLEDQTSSIIGNQYSSSTTYKVGDYCVYENKWYRCIVAIATPETWNPSHWTLTNISNEVTEVQELGQYIRYNQTDETIQVLNNDKWVDIKSVGFTKKYIFKDGNMFVMDTGGLCAANTINGDEYNIQNGILHMKAYSKNIIGGKPNFYTYDSISFYGYSKLIIDWSVSNVGSASLLISPTLDFSNAITLAGHAVNDSGGFNGIEEISLDVPEEYWSYWGKYYIGFNLYGEVDFPNQTSVRQLYLTV